MKGLSRGLLPYGRHTSKEGSRWGYFGLEQSVIGVGDKVSHDRLTTL